MLSMQSGQHFETNCCTIPHNMQGYHKEFSLVLIQCDSAHIFQYKACRLFRQKCRFELGEHSIAFDLLEGVLFIVEVTNLF